MTKNPQDVQGFDPSFVCCPSVDNDSDDQPRKLKIVPVKIQLDWVTVSQFLVFGGSPAT